NTPGGDHCLFAYNGKLQYNGAHPDYGAVFDGAAFQQSSVADGHVVAKQRLILFRSMQHSIILNTRVATNDDLVLVGAQNRSVPDAGPFANLYVADYHCGRSHKSPFAYSGTFSFEFIDHSNHHTFCKGHKRKGYL